MATVAKDRLLIVKEYLKNLRILTGKDILYLKRILGISEKNRAAALSRYIPHLCRCSMANSGREPLSKINEICAPRTQACYWWLSSGWQGWAMWTLCEYSPESQADITLIMDILQRKGYGETKEFPPKEWEYYQQEIPGKKWQQIFWTEPITRDYSCDAGEAEHKEDEPKHNMDRWQKKTTKDTTK